MKIKEPGAWLKTHSQNLQKRSSTTFAKMTVFFVTFGLIPIIIISMVFFYWYYSDVEESTINNYSQITEYLERNLSSMILEVDDNAGYIYDFAVDKYEHLYEILQDETLEAVDRKVFINKMLQDMLMSSANLSSVRFYTTDGDAYVLFDSQGKSLQSDDRILNEITVNADNLHKMVLMPAASEAEFCTNTDSYVFSVVRNYMNTSTVRTTKEEYMGTLYMDIDLKDVLKLTATIDVGSNGNIYVVDPKTDRWIFSSDDSLPNARILANASGGRLETVISENGYWFFCRPLTNTDYYVVLQIFVNDVLDTYQQNRLFIIVIVGFAILIMSIAYTAFSEKMNEPAQKLKRAMQQVRTGNLQVQVDIHTNDEMEYLGEGFNKMVRDLQYYIEQMYIVQLQQKEAELNALKMQIQPHYLYNTLDVIRMTAMENNDPKTARLLESLARQLRYVIGQQGERVPLYRELNSIQEYIVLMNARYNDKFQVNVNVSDSDRQLYVLKLLLQPLVENAIKHGLKQKEGRGTIDISVKRFDDYLEIIVMDDGAGMAPAEEKRLKDTLEGNRAGSDASGAADEGAGGVANREVGGAAGKGTGIAGKGAGSAGKGAGSVGKGPDSAGKGPGSAENRDAGTVAINTENKAGIGLKNVYDRIKLSCGEAYGFTVTGFENIGTMVKFRLPIWEGDANVESYSGR